MALVFRFVLNVADFDPAVAFYRDALGYPVTGGWDRGAQDRGALVEISPGGVIEIVGHGSEFATPSYHHDAVAIEIAERRDVDELRDRLLRAGAVPSAPAAQPWGHYSFSVRDPVGLEIVCFADISGEV